VAHCSSQGVGQKLCKLVNITVTSQDLTDVFQALMYFPIPEIAELVPYLTRIPSSGSTKRQWESLAKLLIFGSVENLLLFAALKLRPSNILVVDTLFELFKRQHFGTVIPFAEQHSIIKLLAD
jgi:hypothetical protein